MKLFNNMKKSVRKVVLGVTAALALTTISLTAASAHTAYAADWSNNAIVKGGASSCQNLITKVKASSELQKIYKQPEFGLYPQYYDDFANHCKHGVATSDNRIVVDGKTYANGVGSIGRLKSYQGSDPRTFHIAGAGQDYYYGNLNSKAFANGTKSIPVDVLINNSGDLQFAVMTGSCANPVYFQHKAPTYSCNELQQKKTGTNTYEYTTDASAGHGAVIDHVVYNFGDGVSVERQNPKTVTQHTFTKDSRVTVTVYVKLPNGSVVKVGNGGDCAKQVKYTPPAAVVACNLLTLTPGKVDAAGNTSYTLTATAAAKNAKITNYHFVFGDNKGAQDVKTDKTSASVTRTYAPGTYHTEVLVTFVTNTGKTVTDGYNGNCVKTLTIKPMQTALVCDELTLTKGDVNATTGATVYTLNAKASTTKAKVTSYVFNFGNGQTQTVNTSSLTASSAAHTYTAGQHNFSVAVNGVDMYGKTFSNVTSPDCKKSIEVKTPECKPGVPVGSPECSTFACTGLTLVPGAINSQTGAQQFNLTATAMKDNATITSYVFNFGDGSANSTITTGATTANSSHIYAPGTYNARVTVFGKDAAGNAISSTGTVCTKTVTVKTPECKPGVPVGSPDCSTLACVNLTLVPGTLNSDASQSYTLNAVASKDNATITSYVFNFGDGSANSTITTGATTATTTHTYVPGNQTATVTVNGTDYTGKTISATSPACSKPVTVTPPQPKNPNITITKTVDGQKSEQVAVGQTFTYQLVIKNTGEKDLINAVVTDAAPAGVTLLTADLGSVTSATAWNYTIPSLAVGQSVTVNLTAKVDAYVAGSLVNTACVNAPEVNPEQPTENDACDTATVTVTPPVTPVTPQTPEVLPNTGAGSILSIFGAAAIIGTIGYRLFLGRRLNRQ